MDNKAYTYSLRLLTGQEYSIQKLRTKLVQKAFEKEDIEDAIKRVVENGYLSEERYTELKVKSLLLRGKSTRFIIHGLGEEGLKIDEQFVQRICESCGIDKNEQLRSLIMKKARSVVKKGVLDLTSRQKIIRFALSKGHPYQEIKKIMAESFKETEENPDFF